MKERRWGRIVNVSSQAAYTGLANHAHYAAAKSGMAGLNFSRAKELSPHGVTVNLVVPGRIKTDILADDLPIRQEEWLGQTPPAGSVASYVMGAALNVGGGLVMGWWQVLTIPLMATGGGRTFVVCATRSSRTTDNPLNVNGGVKNPHSR